MSGGLGQALAYAARGWPVFPCKPGRKEPNTARGFLDATTDAAAIRGWWQRHPDDNVAIATGLPAVDVLDVDVKPGRQRLRGLQPAQGSRDAHRGQRPRPHALRRPARVLRRHRAAVRAAAPPVPRLQGGRRVRDRPAVVRGRYGTGPAGVYELLDQRDGTGQLDWQAVRQLLEPPRPLPPGRPRKSDGTAGLVAWVAALPEGNRNAGLYWAACRMAEADSPPGDFDLLVAAAVQAGLAEAEAQRTVASAARRAAV